MNLKDEYFLKRRQKGINQEEISKFLGCSQSLVSRYEKGTSGMSQKKIEKYRQYIDEFSTKNKELS